MRQKCLLIIDDDYRIREVTKATLELMANWTIFTASSGAEGVRLAQQVQPDVILLDIMMPGLDGFSTLKNLKTETSTQDIPILLLTAKARIDEDERLEGKEYLGVIHKPFDTLQLHTIIATHLGWKS
jgi:CheY-like chemotaxis protein